MAQTTPSTDRICPQCGAETPASLCPRDGFATIGRSRLPVGDPSRREGEVLAGRYRLDQSLGLGPLGVAYRATDLSTSGPLHLRLLPAGLSADLGLVARFQREGRLVAALTHPNIVRVLEHGVAEDGTLFVAQELILGPTLAEVLAREGPLEPQRIIAIAEALLRALSEAHGHGAPHRSLGLGNTILLRRSGGEELVKVSGFGLARSLVDDELQPFVWPGALVDAWRTMAPEQARGRGVSGHADLYSVGAILYELLTGRPVFQERSPSDLLVAHSVKIPKPPELNGRILAGPLVDLILRCLEKKPWNRPDGAKNALEQLEAARARPLLVAPTSTAEFGPPPASETGRPPTARGPGDRSKGQAPGPVLDATGRQPPRSTHPYGVSPPPAAQANVPATWPSPRPAPPGAVDPLGSPVPVAPALAPRNPRSTQPSPATFSAAPDPAGSAGRAGREHRVARSLSYGVHVSPTEPVLPPPPRSSASRDHGEPSEPALVIRGGPSPVVAFLLGLVVAGALGGLAYVLIFGGRDGQREGPGPDALALSRPPVEGPTPPAGAEPVREEVPLAAAPSAPPEATPPQPERPELEAPPVEAPEPERPELTQAELGAPPAQSPEAQPPPPAAEPSPPPEAPEVAPKAPAPAEAKPPRRERPTRILAASQRPPANFDPLADLEDPDFAPRPSPVSQRRVWVDSDPPGAMVAVHGQIIGQTPLHVEWDDASGGVDVVISKVGYQPVRTRLSVGVGRSVRLTLRSSP